MAEFLNMEENENLEVAEDEQLVDFSETPEQEPEAEEANPETAVEEQDAEEEIPEKYKGKSPREIIRMHQEAEKLMGRQSSEVGELRKLVDNFILTQTNNNAPKEEEVEVDFFDDPQKAVEAAIAKHPKVRQAEELSARMRQQEAMTKLKGEHPDFAEVIQSPDFSEWVGKSKVRLELYNRADQAYDYDAANELLSTWKERKAIVSQTEKAEQEALKRSRKAASTGGGSGGEGRSRKVYRRSDIVNLMQNDPARYLELSDEITLAYQEGRVKS